MTEVRREAGFDAEAGPVPTRRKRVWPWILLVLVLLVAVILGVAAWYTSTAKFHTYVRNKVVSVLEDTVGGRIELGSVRWSLPHLTIYAENLTIHGLESPTDVPYLHADQVVIGIRVPSFFSPKINLSLLRVDQPVAHLIVYKDGTTNLPTPRKASTSKKSTINSVFDLAAQHVELVNGIALVNDKAMPFNLDARDLNAHVAYQAASTPKAGDDRYNVALAVSDIATQMGVSRTVHSHLSLKLQLGRNQADLRQLTWDTGIQGGREEHGAQGSRLQASGSLKDFAQPQWAATAKGNFDLRQVGDLVDFQGFSSGVADLDLKGHSCSTDEIAAAQTAAKKPIGERDLGRPANASRPSVDELCGEAYAVEGTADLHRAAFKNPYVDLAGVEVKAHARLTPTFLILTEAAGTFPGGGTVNGQLHVVNWADAIGPQVPPLTTPPAKGAVVKAAAAAPALHAILQAEVNRMPLRSVMQVVSPKGYQELGFDTAGSGSVRLEWGATPASVQASAQLRMAPTGVTPKGATSPGVPVTGALNASYEGRGETVLINTLTAKTTASSFDASGVVGVADGDGKTDLRVDLLTSDLGEFNQLLLTLGVEANGRKGVQAIPVELHGTAQFHGTAVGGLHTLDVKGHLQAQQIDAVLDGILPPPTTTPGTGGKPSLLPASLAAPPAVAPRSPTPAVPAPTTSAVANGSGGSASGPAAADLTGTPRRLRLDSVVADGEYFPGGLTVETAVIERAGATITLSGKATPKRIYRKNPWPEYVWDKRASVDVSVAVKHGVLGDVLHLAGLDLPVSGIFDANGHVTGTLADLNGGGQFTLHGGQAYGEPYQTLVVDLRVRGQEVEASHFALTLLAGQITGNGGYNLATKKVQAHLDGKIDLPKLEAMKGSKVEVKGQLTMTADANGTLQEPNLRAHAQLAGLALGGEPMGGLIADLHSQNGTLFYTSTSNLINAKLEASGQTQLSGNYQSQAKLAFTGVDIDSLLRLYAPQGITGHSSIGGTVTLDGPLKLPKQLNGAADLNQFEVKISGIDLKESSPLRLSVRNGILKIDQFHIVGPDTDLTATGTADLLNTAGGGGLRVHTEGAINMALAQTLDTDLTSSGRVKFTVDVRGTTRKPDLRGMVQFTDVNLGLQDLANGLSQVNGTLTFDQDRLQVEKLTGMTGGGQLELGGYVGFSNGLYADLTARGDAVRLRYPPGVSSTANADLRLQGTQGNALLSGTVLLTKFELGANFDAASLASSTGGLTAPPDPNAPSSHITLDVHITSAPQLDFQNSYAKLAGDVNLRIRGTVSNPSVLGKITITDGSATFAGTKYELQRGDIYFTNPVRIAPIIDLDATARVRDYDLTIGLHGPADNLQPTYRSSPPLSEADIFALLALGRTQEQAQIYQQQETAAGANSASDALLYGALNATVSNRVQKLFGVGSVKVDPSFVGTMGNSAARITVEQSVAKNVTLTYATNVNATAEQLIQVQWDLTRNVSLVAVRDETGVFSLIFKLRRLYR